MKVTITDTEVRKAEAAAVAAQAPSASSFTVPWPAATAAALLTICLPALCAFALGVRISLRKRDRRLRNAWDRLLCTLLITSGFVTSLAFAALLIFPQWRSSARAPVTAIALKPLDLGGSFPEVPARSLLDAQGIAEESQSLVFIATPDPGFAPTREYLNVAPIGAATLLMASDEGYLLATNNHVVDAGNARFLHPNGSAMYVFTRDRVPARAEIAGRSDVADIALLWFPRKPGGKSFFQPVAKNPVIHVGEPVYVIGHPQRLFYTLSSGLLSRAEDSMTLQISAPVSPGNSGGPLYDGYGNLLGIVASKVDREQSPNAENLNFAVRATLLLEKTGWTLTRDGRRALDQFRHLNSPNGK
jgi:S1-C subfamily serine protease